MRDKNSVGANEGWRIQKGPVKDEEFGRDQWEKKDSERTTEETGVHQERMRKMDASQGWKQWGKGEPSDHQNRIESIKDEETKHRVVKI